MNSTKSKSTESKINTSKPKPPITPDEYTRIMEEIDKKTEEFYYYIENNIKIPDSFLIGPGPDSLK